MRWTDIQDIAIELEDAHPEKDNLNLRYTDLHKWVCALEAVSYTHLTLPTTPYV